MNQKYQSFLAHMKGRHVAVVGVGVSNTPLLRLLVSAGAKVSAYDRSETLACDTMVSEFPEVSFHTGEHYLDDLTAEVIFRSPGVKPFEPQLLAAGATLTSEMEVFFQLCPCPIYGVTGSDGKTTTTTILTRFLETAGKKIHTGGNIGTPLLDRVGEIQPEDIAVVELSSFQLMTMKNSPQTAIITNLSPNHLDWHRSMEEYIMAKSQICTHQGPNDRLVMNYDNPASRELAGRLGLQPIWFSRLTTLERGVWLEGNTIVRDGVPVLETTSLQVPGAHNVENYMAAIAAAGDAVSAEGIQQVADLFTGVAHRLELVADLGGVRYINDSIASSPTRTLAGLSVFPQKVFLIAGGRPKVPFDDLAAVIGNHAKAVLLVGEAAPVLRKAFTGKVPLYDCGTVDEAVRQAATLAQPGDVVLLSPACTSFDQFKNFEVRGQLFKKTVEELSLCGKN